MIPKSKGWQIRFRENEGASNMVSIKTSQRGLQKGWTRNTFILRKEYLEKIKALAYWERKTIKDLVDEALGLYLKGRKIKPI
jgi:uncharacterized protein YnzC (UPF0291/DUF896 family)